LQHTATHCNTLQHTAKHLQHTALLCNTPQHIAPLKGAPSYCHRKGDINVSCHTYQRRIPHISKKTYVCVCAGLLVTLCTSPISHGVAATSTSTTHARVMYHLSLGHDTHKSNHVIQWACDITQTKPITQ